MIAVRARIATALLGVVASASVVHAEAPKLTVLSRPQGKTVDFKTMHTARFKHQSAFSRDMFVRYAKGRPGTVGLVLLHGNGAESRLYQGIANAAIRAGVPLVLPDLPGQGQSDEGREVRLADFPYAVRELIEATRAEGILDDYRLAGHSLGAITAVDTAGWFDAHLKGLDLIDPPVSSDAIVEHYAGRAGRLGAFGGLVQSMMQFGARQFVAPKALRRAIVERSRLWGDPTDDATVDRKLEVALSLYDQWENGMYDLKTFHHMGSPGNQLPIRLYSAGRSIQPRALAENVVTHWQRAGRQAELVRIGRPGKPIDHNTQGTAPTLEDVDHLSILDHPNLLGPLVKRP